MNFKFKSIALFLAVSILGLTSCSDDENIVAKPEINNIEIGPGNNLTAYIGADLHMEAEVLAAGLIDKISVEIHKEDGTGEEIEAEYTDYSGQRNATFHKHIDIPEGIAAGEYHFHLTVTDMEGNATSIDKDIMIEELQDDEAPVINISNAPSNGQTFANGETISISGSITDNIALEGMLVALVYEDDAIADADVKGNNEKIIVMMHTHDFDHPDETDFTASINVGAAMDNDMTPATIEGENAWKSGNYYLLVKTKDAKSNGAISQRYPITINL